MRISRSTGVLSGFLVLLLGIWAGIIPFVGPYFHYSFGSNETWHYTANRFWLDILPAVTVVAGSLIVLRSGNRLSGVLGSWLGIAGGAWLVVGPAFSRIWEHGGVPIGSPMYGHTRQAIELLGYFYGVGVLITALSAFALARFVSRPGLRTADPDVIAAPADYARPAAAQASYEQPAAGQPDYEPVAAQAQTEFEPATFTHREPVAFTHRGHVIDDDQRSPAPPAGSETQASGPETQPVDSTAPVHH